MKKYTLLAGAVLACAALFGTLALGTTPAAASVAFDGFNLGQDSLLFVGAGIVITRQSLQTLGIGFKALFQGGLGQAEPMYTTVATVVNSTTGKEEYGWLGKIPGMREWIGDRVVHGLETHGYSIKNKDFELTVSVNKNDIDDDNLGTYAPLFTELGRASGAHPDELVWALLQAGFTSPCFDGQNYFDTDHPVLDADGNAISVANTDGGAGSPWFLMDDTRAIKPVIFQSRKKPEFVALDKPDDTEVFKKKEFIYGVDSRCNVGFGLWQFCWGSKQTLDAAHFETAYTSLVGMKGDYGRPLGLRPRTLVVGASNIAAAAKVVGAKELAGGGDNPWYGKAKVVEVPWLA